MDIKYQIFISSTFVDLQQERRSVIEAILNMGHIPVGMEAFQAGDDTQWEYIKRRIDESDYYVVIVGERYGSQEKGKSYTQMEYEYAVAKNVPVAAFLLDPNKRKEWPTEKVEYEQKDKLERFRSLCEKKVVKYWKNSDDLGVRVLSALYELMREKPRTGWVRADALPSAAVLEEMSRLSEEKRRLQTELDALSKNEKELIIPAKVHWLISDLKGRTADQFCDGLKINPINISLFEIFWNNIGNFASGINAWRACDIVEKQISGKNDYDAVFNKVASKILGEIIVTGLIENTLITDYSFSSPRSENQIKMTEFGKEFIMFNREITNRDQENRPKNP